LEDGQSGLDEHIASHSWAVIKVHSLLMAFWFSSSLYTRVCGWLIESVVDVVRVAVIVLTFLVDIFIHLHILQQNWLEILELIRILVSKGWVFLSIG